MTAIAIPPIVSVDSVTLVQGLREIGPEEKCKRCVWLFRQFELRKTQVVMPSVVLAEYLTPFGTEAHAEVIRAIDSRFLIKSS